MFTEKADKEIDSDPERHEENCFVLYPEGSESFVG